MKSAIILAITGLCLLGCLLAKSAMAANYSTNTKVQNPATLESSTVKRLPDGVMRAPENTALTCAKLSQQINQDKQILRSILGEIANFDCNNTAVTPSPQCARLLEKQRNYEARIESNQNRARELGCM